MALLASSLIDWNALGKIVLAALIGGAGVVIVFGILLLGLKEANSAESGGARFAGYALTSIIGSIIRLKVWGAWVIGRGSCS